MDEIKQARLDKLARLRDAGINPYADGFERDHDVAEAHGQEDGTRVRVAGRVMVLRKFGGLIFADLMDHSGRGQISFEEESLGKDGFEVAADLVDGGDFIGVAGEMWTTRKGERTVRVTELAFLSKSLRPLPEKWAGLKDPELRVRQRYLDLLVTEGVRDKLGVRAAVIAFLRHHLDVNGFVEVETPMLQPVTSGAAAKPFVTHHEALDRDLYLRVAPETYLKRLLVGGFDRVYEIGKSFRNEGTDPSHLQEFTMLEWYAAYWNYRDNMTFIQDMLQQLVRQQAEGTTIEFQGNTLEFGGSWPEIDYRDAVQEATGIDLTVIRTHEELASAAAAIPDFDVANYSSYPSLIDAIYKRTVRPKLVAPCFLVGHPAELVPLARRSDEDPTRLDMFQVVAGTWELVKAYSEVIDPVDQADRMNEQAEYRAGGDEETMMKEDDYIEAMEHGMPPNSGMGMGIDRLVAILTDSPSLREVVAFPQVRS